MVSHPLPSARSRRPRPWLKAWKKISLTKLSSRELIAILSLALAVTCRRMVSIAEGLTCEKAHQTVDISGFHEGSLTRFAVEIEHLCDAMSETDRNAGYRTVLSLEPMIATD